MKLLFQLKDVHFRPGEEDIGLLEVIDEDIKELLSRGITREISLKGEDYSLNFFPQLYGEFVYISGFAKISSRYRHLRLFAFHPSRLRN